MAAATALNVPLGSIYAFSVFLEPLESLLGLTRADLAFVFALSAAGFAAGMNLVPLTFGRAPAPLLALGCAGLSALGIALAATAGGLGQLALGYGVCFGAGVGAAYILFQQIVNLAVTSRHGLVNGYIVSLLPTGAMIAAPVFGGAIPAIGVRAALGWFAAVLALLGLVSAWLTARSGVTLEAATAGVGMREDERRRAVFWRLWLVFFLAASAGLMVLSQAAAIITAYGGTAGPRRVRHDAHHRHRRRRAAGRRLDGGLARDPRRGGRRACPRALAGSVALTLWPGAGMSVLALALVGCGYGLVSGATAAAIAVYWRRALYGRVASRIYLAWSAAAIVLPIIAGTALRPDPGLWHGGADRRRRQRRWASSWRSGCLGRDGARRD